MHFIHAAPGQTLFAFPASASLAHWEALRVPLVEDPAPDAGRYQVQLNLGQDARWLIFAGASQPAWADAIQVIELSQARAEWASQNLSNSWVGIANMALILLGEETITSLADDTKRARLANARLFDTRDRVLRAHPWHCARARATLAKLVTPPAFGFESQFQLPVDCLRVLKINQERYQVEGRRILAGGDLLELLYIRRVEDPTQLDDSCKGVLAAALAIELAEPLVASTDKLRAMGELYEARLREARHVNALESQDQRFQADDWSRARDGAGPEGFYGHLPTP